MFGIFEIRLGVGFEEKAEGREEEEEKIRDLCCSNLLLNSSSSSSTHTPSNPNSNSNKNEFNFWNQRCHHWYVKHTRLTRPTRPQLPLQAILLSSIPF